MKAITDPNGYFLCWLHTPEPADLLRTDLVDVPYNENVNNLYRIFAGEFVAPAVNAAAELEAAQAAKWEEIKRRRRAEELSPITCQGYVYDADEDSQSKLAGAVQIAAISMGAGQPFSIEWTLSDNTAVTLDAAGMLAVGLALGARTSALYAYARTLRTQIFTQSYSLADVAAVAWAMPQT